MVEVLKHAPAELNPTERLTLVAIAESCRSDTRMTYYRDGWDAAELARRVGVTSESLTKVFRSLAAKGCEVRVAHAVKNGKPVFAFKGKQTTFKLPRFAPQRSDEDRTMDTQRVDESPVFSEGSETKGWTSVRQRLDESPGFEAQSLDESPPLLLKDLPSKNTSPPTPALSGIPHPRGSEVNPEGGGDEDSSTPNPNDDAANQLVNLRNGELRADQRRTLQAVITSALDAGWSPADIQRELTAPTTGLNNVGAGLIGRIRNLGTPPANRAATRVCGNCDGTRNVWMEMFQTTVPCTGCVGTGVVEPASLDDRPCPLHRGAKWHRCPSCWGDVKAGQDPFRYEPDKRPDGWYEIYRAKDLAEERDREQRRARGERIPYRDPVDISVYKNSKI